MARRRFLRRRGVSPLIATVVLIGFAVSIGAVVMSWGKSAFEKVEKKPGDDANLAWYLGSNVENLCYTDDSISFTLKGSPKINIKSVYVAAEGREDLVFDQNFNIPENEAENTNVKVPFDVNRHGELSRLIIGSVDNSVIMTPGKRCG